MSEIIGKFAVRNGMIEAPPGAEGEYILELNKNGSFIFKPTAKATVKGDLTFEVWDSEIPDVISPFGSETQAMEYKSKMERFYGKPYRMRKVFSSAKKNGKLAVE